MTDIVDLRQQLEVEPNDHEKRWRLAKKLYLASEYREALMHLRILKKEWDHKLNIVRYLAATYYRMGRYDEAIAELKAAISEWPDENPLREQLAKVFEAADQRDKAAEVWEELAERDPEHPYARQAAKRLRKKKDFKPRQELDPFDSNGAIESAKVVICARCGAQNNREFENCWQCKAPLSLDAIPSTPVPRKKQPEANPAATLIPMAMGSALVAVLTSAVYLTLRYFPHGDPPVPHTVLEVLMQALAIERMLLGGLLLVVWPLAVSFALNVYNKPDVWRGAIIWTGIGLAASCYLAVWLPLQFVPIGLAAVLLVALPVNRAAFHLPWGMTTGIWLIQLVPVIAALAAIMLFTSGKEVLAQSGAILRYASVQDGVATPGVHKAFTLQTDEEFELRWLSTDSEWLDAEASLIAFEVQSEPVSPPLRLELYDADEDLVEFAELRSTTVEMKARIEPEQAYRLVVRGDAETALTLTPHGVLKPAVAG